MSNVSEIYTLWLKPWHLPAGKPISVTIEKVETRTIHPRPTEERTALILTFAGKNRKLILNDGNANKMSDIGGEDWTAWRGLVIQLKRAQFTKDKETIYLLPAPGNLPSVVADPMPQKEAIAPVKTNGNGHTDEGPIGPTLAQRGQKPYPFPSTAAEKFYQQVQEATDNFYKGPAEMVHVIGGWFNFGSQDLLDEKLSAAIDHARQMREAQQPVEVEDQSKEEATA